MPGSANETGTRAEYITLCGHESLSRPGPPVIAIEKSQQAPDTEAASNGIADSEDTLPDA